MLGMSESEAFVGETASIRLDGILRILDVISRFNVCARVFASQRTMMHSLCCASFYLDWCVYVFWY